MGVDGSQAGRGERPTRPTGESQQTAGVTAIGREDEATAAEVALDSIKQLLHRKVVLPGFGVRVVDHEFVGILAVLDVTLAMPLEVEEESVARSSLAQERFELSQSVAVGRLRVFEEDNLL